MERYSTNWSSDMFYAFDSVLLFYFDDIFYSIIVNMLAGAIKCDCTTLKLYTDLFYVILTTYQALIPLCASMPSISLLILIRSIVEKLPRNTEKVVCPSSTILCR